MRRMEVRRGGEEEDGLREKERERERGGCHCINIGGAATPTPQSNIRWDGMGWEVVSKKRQHKRARTHLSLSLSA